jgi:predicted Ser/Thr protein kinase
MIFVNDVGVVMGRPGNFKTTTAAQGLPDVDSAIIALDGTVWLGGASGIYRWPQPQRLEYWTPRDGSDVNFGICRVGNKMFAGNGQEGIEVLSDDQSRWLPLPKTKPLGQVMDLIPDLQGGLFAGLRRGGVAQVRADGSISALAGLPAVTGAKLLRTLDKQVWAAGIGIYRVKQAGNRLMLKAEKLPDERPIVVDLDFTPKGGKLFACWEGGLLHKELDGWQKFTTKDGLREDRCRTLAVMPNGDVWAGYATIPSFALIRIGPSGKVTVRDYPSSWKGGAASLCFLDVDSRGWLWRGTQDGIYVADPRDAEKGLWTRLDEVDGLPNSDPNQQGFYNDSDGSVWWLAADRSVTHFRPSSDFVRPAFAPKVFVSSFSWNGEAAKLAGTADAAPHGATITAHIGTLQFDRRNALRLRYRVLPGQTEWRDSRDLDLPLGVMGWGDHTLEVAASLGTGPWSGTSAQVFQVLRPFWATWPFLIGFAALGMAAGFGGYRWEQRRKEIENRALPDLSALRVEAVVPEARWLIGTALDGRFVPKEVLARGGFATVFDGHDKKQHCRCAIKVFHRDVADKGLAQRFAQEVTALETVVHPNVVRIYGHGETPSGVPYLVMEFIEGATLRDAIPPEGLPPRKVASLLRQAGHALAAIHSHGICHRDLKPENLMIRNDKLVLIDFSIAIVKSPDKTVHGLSRAAGTIQYMAPEQAVGWADASSDIYSLAKVAMEMMTGKRLSELLPEASRDLPERVREFLAGVPLGLSAESIDLIGAALAFDPERRPQGAVAFAEKVAADLEG